MSKDIKGISKFISFILRHKPDALGLVLDENGWANVDELIEKANANNEWSKLDFDILQRVVETSDKKRFAFNDDLTKIRANQGHSIEVDLQLTATTPPVILYHGTAESFLDSIMQTGLQKMDRHHVHLSETRETAHKVAQRKGKPILLVIDAAKMHADGIEFYLSENNVWLVEAVDARYILESGNEGLKNI